MKREQNDELNIDALDAVSGGFGHGSTDELKWQMANGHGSQEQICFDAQQCHEEDCPHD